MSHYLISGECQNSSPAGKRRIPSGAEQSGEGNMAAIHKDAAAVDHLNQYTPFTIVTTMAVTGCVAIVVLFGVIFALLQV